MRRKAGRGEGREAGDGDEGAGALEIEFEDGDGPSEGAAYAAGRPRDLRGAALAALTAVTLGAALSATQHTGSNSISRGATEANIPIVMIEPDYTEYVVTVSYHGSRLVSLQQRRLAVDLRITPLPGARVRILNYYVEERGVLSRMRTALSRVPLPVSGADAELELTVNDCAVVPIGESMSFVNVVADGPAGVTDRFTILGEKYSSDLTRLLSTVCPARGVAGGAA
jgi:hypothetical protein